MRKFLEKRVLPVLAAVCLLVTMVAVAMTFASAAEPGKLDEDGNYTPKTINFKIGSYELANGEGIAYDTTLFFTGDTLKNNQGNYWKDFNGRFTYTGTDAQYTGGNIYWLYIKNNTTGYEKGVAVGRGEQGNFALTAGEWQVKCLLEQAEDSTGTTVGNKEFIISTFTVVDPDPLRFPADKPVIADVTNKTIIITPVDGHEYSIDGTTWQSSNVFANLTPSTKYTVYQRVAANGSEPAGVMSEGVSVTTLKVNYGSQDTTIDFSPRNIIMTPKGGNLDEYAYNPADPSNTVDFSNGTVMIDGVEYAAFFVGDSIQNNGQYWTDVDFTTSTNGNTKIYNAYLKKEGSDYSKHMQVGYGHTDGGSNNPITFTEPGEYYIISGNHGDMEIARFHVFWPTEDIIDQLAEQSKDGGAFYYERQRVNLVVTDTTGTFCDYVGTDVVDIHVSDSLYIDTVWSNYLFEYRTGGQSYQGTVESIYLYGVKGEIADYNEYIPDNRGETDQFVDVGPGFGEDIDVNDPNMVGKKLYTLEHSGTYAIYGNVKTGDKTTSVYLGSFVVTDTPTVNKLNDKFTNSNGKYDDVNEHVYAYQSREIKYYVDTPSSYLGQYLSFSEDCNDVFYVTDKLVNGSYWDNYKFDYTDVYGKLHTGKIFNMKYILVTDEGNKEMGWGQVGYGNTTRYTGDPFELTEPGLWMLIGQQIEDDTNGRINNIVMATFTVFPLDSDDPRGTGDQFTDVSDALKWSGSFNDDDFKDANPSDSNDAGTDYIDANGYLYVQHDPATQTKSYASIKTIAPLRLGTMFNITATYAKNIEVGHTPEDKFNIKVGTDIGNTLEFVVEYDNNLGIYQGKLYYQGAVLGTVDFTDDYKSAIGTYKLDNNLGKITVLKDDKALTFTSEASGKAVTSFDISKDYYFNVTNVEIGVGGQGSYIPYLGIKPIDPTVVNLTKTISITKFDPSEWKGSTGSIDSEGRLSASGRDTPTITTTTPYNLGNSFEVSSNLMRTNGFTNYYGEKYALSAGDITLKVGNAKAGESQFVAEIYYKDVLLGTADRGTAGGYSISANWIIRFENGNISVVAKESKDGTTNTVKFISEATGNEVSSFQVDEWDFERTYISVTAAGNYGPGGSAYVNGLVMTPGIGGTSGVGSTAGSSGTASTGDATTSLFIILAVLVAAGTVLVTVRKVTVA